MNKVNLVILIGSLIFTHFAFSSELPSASKELPQIKKMTVKVDIIFPTHILWRIIDNGKMAGKPIEYKTWHTICFIKPKELSDITRTLRAGKSYPGEALAAYKSDEAYIIVFPEISKIKEIECVNLVGIVSGDFIKPRERYFAPTVEEAQKTLKGVINMKLEDSGDID